GLPGCTLTVRSFLSSLVGCENYCGGKRGHWCFRAEPGSQKNGRREPAVPPNGVGLGDWKPPHYEPHSIFNCPAIGSALITANLLMRCPYTVKAGGCQGKVGDGSEINPVD